MKAIRLIVNADDLGMSRGITDGIILAHRYGFLTSASLMANMPAAEYAVARARAFPRLAVGVHLNICQGRPLLPASGVPSLVGADGNFHSPREMARRLWTQRVASAEIEREFREQILWMKARGLPPSHADSHHHMHLYPAAARAFARALAAEDISCARSCRCAEWPKRRVIGGPYSGGVVRRICVQAYRRALQRTVFRHFGSPDSRVAISLGAGPRSMNLRERWKATLENLPPGTFELSCHPGLFERGFSEGDAIRTWREEELLCLADLDVREVIDRRGIQLVTYRELPGNESAACASEAVA